MSYCPECGGELKYAPALRRHVCRSCGLSLSHQELVEARQRRPEFESEEERRKKERREYLKWWLSSKKK